jgi:16S rRNA (guanine966-N2)-methyltransferase
MQPLPNSLVAAGQQLRIIGGRWRGRKLSFAPVPELRPTPDRVRETLFNWLRDAIAGARCLDLFAGSGALSLEALSRGAAHITMIDRHAEVIRTLQEQLKRLKVQDAELLHADALSYLGGPVQAFDVVFLDPPFKHKLLPPCLALLAHGGWLVPGAYVYAEAERDAALPPLCADWQISKHKKAGQVGYYLLRYHHALEPTT